MIHLKRIVIVAMILNILLIIVVLFNNKVHNHSAISTLGLAFITLTFILSILHRHATSLKSRSASNSNRSNIKL